MTTGLTSAKVSFRRLNCIESKNLTRVVIPHANSRQINPTILQSSYRIDFLDGDIYKKVRQYQQENNDYIVNKWIQQLSPCKQIALKKGTTALKNKGIANALNALLEFLGL